MPSRRAFIQSGIAVSALAAHPIGARAAIAPIRTIVVERGLAGSAVFAAESARHSVDVLETPADLGSLWMSDIEPRLRRGPVVIAGFMSAGPLFCLETLARDYGLMPVYRIRHMPSIGSRFDHTAEGTDRGTDWARRLSAAGARWPAAAAEMLAEASTVPARTALDLPDAAAARSNTGDAVYTWLLAPDSHRRALLPVRETLN